MGHSGAFCNPLPVPAALIQRGAYLDVKVGGHDPIIAKFCAVSKQPIAHWYAQSAAMAKTLNQILAANLRAQMDKKGLSANALGKLAGLSPRTVGNYLRGDDPQAPASKSGKKRSAKLEEVEMLAAGLGVPAQALLVDADTVQQVAQRVAADLMNAIGGSASDHPKDEPRKRRAAGA